MQPMPIMLLVFGVTLLLGIVLISITGPNANREGLRRLQAVKLRHSDNAVDKVEAQYRKAVLAALEDAEASLSRFGAQRIALARAAEARAAADHAATLQAGRVAGGTLPQSEALIAERQALAARSAELAAATQLTAGFVAVEKALGLGWSEK